MTSQAPSTAPTPIKFATQELRALRMLRTRYEEGGDLFSAHEMAHLRFVRWLVQTGRLNVEVCDDPPLSVS
jgi:hypothetical protein